jgi:protein-tyrosine phosphatase
VITHPERNPLLQGNAARLQKWVGLGCAVQITAQSLGGRFGQEAKLSAWRTLRKGLVHVVASDAHDVTDRPPRLDIARKALTREMGTHAAALLLVENPAAILIGAPIEPVAPKKRWYSFGQLATTVIV